MRKPMAPASIDRAIAHRGSLRRQIGLTLVEIMVSLTLGLVVLLAVGSVYIGSRQTYRVQEDNARIQEAGKYALEVIGRSIRQAGADAEMTFNPVAITTVCGSAAPCNAIAGTNAATDTLTVQSYAGREEFNPPSNPGVWVARDCTGGAVEPGVAPGGVITNTFDVTGGNLRCTGSVGGTQPLISDVEDLQVLYGIDIDPVGQPGYQSADRYVDASNVADWRQVVTARVCVQVRSANNGLAATAQRFMNCGGALGTAALTAGAGLTDAGDLRLHRTFVATYNLRNRVNGAP